MSNLTVSPEEVQALQQVGIDPKRIAVIEAISTGVQVASEGRDQNGTPVLVFAFMVPLPAGLLRPKATILGPDGQPVGGGLQEAMPLPPKVRMLISFDALPPSMVEKLEAARAAAEKEAANPDENVVPFPSFAPRG